MTNLQNDPPLSELTPEAPCVGVEVLPSRKVPLGGLRAMTVHRTLPERGRPLVGPWCFVDHYGPDKVAETGGMFVARHPHCGLATVSWLFTGALNHLDSAGNAARVKPGELNLMLAGRGITHQEISTDDTEILHGVQLWYALPDSTRNIENEFTHYVPKSLSVPGGNVKVFIGSLLGDTSPVNTHTDEALGAEILICTGQEVEIELREDFEYCVLAENSSLTVNDHEVKHRELAYIPPQNRKLTISGSGNDSDGFSRAILLGGIPFNEKIIMWWNFIGRTHEEIVEYRRRYQAELGFEEFAPEDLHKRPLFGNFPDGQPDPIPAPQLPNARLKPRG